MPYLKPGEVIDVQEQLVELMEKFSTVEDMYKNGKFNSSTVKFLEKNPVTGEIDDDCEFIKVNGVWVDVDSVIKAKRQRRPIERVLE